MAAVGNRAQAVEPPAGMSPYQYAVVMLCCLINISDGFDVVSLAVAAPVLSKEWQVDPGVLGTIFSAAAIGLTIGAFLVAPLADKIGRRPVMLGSLASLTIAVSLTSVASALWQLFVLRLVTGIGLGTLVVCLNVTVADYASTKARNLSMAILHTGFTIGMMLGSGIAALVLETIGWRAVFVAAGTLNVITLVLSFFILGESRDFLVRRQAARDLARLNRLQRRMRLDPFAAMPPRPAIVRNWRTSLTAMLEPGLRGQTILIWIASLTYAIVGYFLLNWKPTILANAGLTPTLAAASGIITGACGALGHLAMGLAGRRVGEGRLTAMFFTGAMVTLVIFGIQPPDPIPLLAMAGLTTFFVVGAYTGLFLVAVNIYAPSIQATGVGFVVGFGRVGAIVGPMIGGFLLSTGLDRMGTYFVFSAIAIIPAITMHLANRLAAGKASTGDFDAEPARQAV
ncbi:MFS transporter [Hephaestia sp. GCM10023244]|uniref:MFS transporter n=1 Tax=unclassified Hephaestia TaxID=2631281 RepID=UPI0020775562|nr:MFS transporter [Hephaestia sp. MAHUQ-44]MCM8732289.1 MFS transporter [Hephaestia sp. MAHUQ-44]